MRISTLKKRMNSSAGILMCETWWAPKISFFWDDNDNVYPYIINNDIKVSKKSKKAIEKLCSKMVKLEDKGQLKKLSIICTKEIRNKKPVYFLGYDSSRLKPDYSTYDPYREIATGAKAKAFFEYLQKISKNVIKCESNTGWYSLINNKK
jgi:hypothetical protein